MVKFCDLVPDMKQFESGGLVTMELPEMRMAKDDDLRNPQIKSKEVSVSWQGYAESGYIQFEFPNGEGHGWNSRMTIVTDKKWEHLSSRDVILYLQLRPHMKALSEKVVAELQPAVDKVKVIFDRFREVFGRELLIAGL